MDQEEGLTAVDNIVTQFTTYEDFLDSQITTVDLYYLEDEGLARQLVELGYRGTGEVVKREDFEARKAAIEIARLAERTQKKTLTSAGKNLQDNFLKALAVREEDNRNGKVSLNQPEFDAAYILSRQLASVIFIRDRNSHGQEVSGYIDYAHRLKIEDFEVYFSGKKRLLPKPTDLSFYNWDSHIAVWNSSPNYQVIADNPEGLLFKYKRDRKILNVDPKTPPGDNSTRMSIQTDLYMQVVIFDHISRRKV
ncbi:cilia- and flagella-associated protein 299 isoform X2 [Trichechus manatus latirostris]|uniref:Cilia- and flagella-associated protein 299 n=1 Tax=Trichechus manatus latirostris TaxID=127582 RepID=A0A2Y9RDH5_TRIMA|nr:cilia- and flagella-associated protein 299 isoform X1 [Trichechus manatus latirostris]XP_023593370.1 cilia- and flagella-associated protein 299 isoform X2 [Trichechus manatus latirostris]